MKQELDFARTAGEVEALKNLGKSLQQVVDQAPSTGGDTLMRLLKDGNWVYGPESIEVEEGSTWAINPHSVLHGYSCWTRYADPKIKNVLLGEHMVKAIYPKPDRLKLPEHRGPEGLIWEWSDQISMQMQCMSGEDQGTQVLYKTTSVGGIRATTALLAEVMARANRDNPAVVPIVKLDQNSYPHKSYGRTYYPIFTIVSWVDLNGNPEGSQPKPEPVPEPEVAARAKAKLTEKAEQTAEEPAPRRRASPAVESEDSPPWARQRTPEPAKPTVEVVRRRPRRVV